MFQPTNNNQPNVVSYQSPDHKIQHDGGVPRHPQDRKHVSQDQPISTLTDDLRKKMTISASRSADVGNSSAVVMVGHDGFIPTMDVV